MWQDISQDIRLQLARLGFALSFAPAWAVSAIILLVAFIAALILHVAILMVLRRLTHGKRPYLRKIIEATKNPTRLAVLVVAFAIALPAAPLGLETRHLLFRCLALATICLFGWAALTVTDMATHLYLRNFRMDVEDNLLARKHVTQVRVLVRVL